MAVPTTSTAGAHTTWLDYYIRVLSEGEEIPNSVFDELVEEYLNDDEKYLNSILSNPRLNFILTPSTRKGYLNCIHHCSVCEDDSRTWIHAKSGKAQRTDAANQGSLLA